MNPSSPFRTSPIREVRSLTTRSLATLLLLPAIFAVGCGGNADAEGAVADGKVADTAKSAPAAEGVQAAKAAGTIDKATFSTVLPEGWEILADDFDRMGLMTLAEKGTGGSQGVYLKFEKGFNGDPMKNIEKFAAKYEGSAPETTVRAGIPWARTSYTYNGITQSLNITAHGGQKVTFTVMGDAYDASPGVKAIFDGLKFK